MNEAQDEETAMSSTSEIDWSAKELTIKKDAPDWFLKSVNTLFESRIISVLGCDIHFLHWNKPSTEKTKAGILLVHGGGAHANWWRFIAPLLTDYNVAALDLSGMGDSGRRTKYSASNRSDEILSVLDSCFSENKPRFLVGHSFGGYMSMRFAADYGEKVAGTVIVDSPLYRPDTDLTKSPRRALEIERYYPSFEIALERFKLLPPQECKNDYILEFIARHSIKKTDKGWTWKFDVGAMGDNRWEEPFHEHLQNAKSKIAFLYGEKSALVNKETVDYVRTLMPKNSFVVEIPEAAHHIMLDQPKSFVKSLENIFGTWLNEQSHK